MINYHGAQRISEAQLVPALIESPCPMQLQLVNQISQNRTWKLAWGWLKYLYGINCGS